MSKLTQEQRDKLKASQFVFPERRSYPVHDEGHGAAALSMVAKHGSPEEQKKVRNKVCSLYPNLPSCKAEKYTNPLD